MSKLIDLHDNLLRGPAGRKVNGIGALALLVLAATGLVIWWPGSKTWRRSLTLHRGVGWKRWTWRLHSMIGFWSLGFMLIFGVSGAYLSAPEPFQDLADRLEPSTAANADCASAIRLFIGSPSCISAASTESGSHAAAPDSATRRRKLSGRSSDWLRQRCL